MYIAAKLKNSCRLESVTKLFTQSSKQKTLCLFEWNAGLSFETPKALHSYNYAAVSTKPVHKFNLLSVISCMLCWGEKTQSIDWELNFWWLTCSLHDSWGRRETNNSSNSKWLRSATRGFLMANYDIPYATSETGGNGGMLNENSKSIQNNGIYLSQILINRSYI